MKTALIALGFPNFRFDIAQKNLESSLVQLSQRKIEADCCGKVLIAEDKINQEVERIAEENPDLLIVQCGTYSYGSALLKINDLLPNVPLILWGFTEPILDQYFGLPLNSLCAMNMYASFLKRLGHGFDYVYGDVSDAGVYEKIASLYQAYIIKEQLRKTRFCVIGGRVPGFYMSDVDELGLKSSLGIEVVRYSLARLIADMAAFSAEQTAEEVQIVRQYASTVSADDHSVEETTRFLLAVDQFQSANGIDSFAVECWPDLQSILRMSPCAAVSMLNEKGIMTSCEGDLPALVTMYMQYLVTKQPCFLANMVNINQQGIFKAWHCGPAPKCTADSKAEVCMTMHPTMKEYGPAMDFRLKTGKITVLKFSQFNGKNRMLILPGESVEPDRKMIANQCDIKFNAPSEDVLATIMNSGIEHHYVIAFADVEKELIQLCRILNIEIIQA